MRLVSVNVGRPREIQVPGEVVLTSIFKNPVPGPVRVTRLNLDGDEQSDLSVHGGVNKAVYAYPSEHYAFWRRELPDAELPWGAFGENLTTEGPLESTTHIGDRFRIGTAELVVTQPRMPCFKLALKFGREDMITRFLKSGLSGFYLSVAEEGEVAAGNPIVVLSRADAPSIAEVLRNRRTEHRS
jgi:MOSC domain-containing protein YiiM